MLSSARRLDTFANKLGNGNSHCCPGKNVDIFIKISVEEEERYKLLRLVNNSIFQYSREVKIKQVNVHVSVDWARLKCTIFCARFVIRSATR